jgi:peptide deformylase
VKIITLALLLSLASCSLVSFINGQNSLTFDELQWLDMRTKGNTRHIYTIETPEQQTILEKPSRIISPNSLGIDKLIVELEKTARRHAGMGIAAVQIGIPVRVVSVRRGGDGGAQWFQPLINPSIIHASAKRVASWEHCLSVPWGYRFTYRPAGVTVKYQTATGEESIETLQGDEAIVLQQEIDHLDGTLLSEDYSKARFIPADQINAFALAVWKQCLTLTQQQCDGLMKMRWEERGKTLSKIPD